jgi:hypothetical protein
MASRKKAKTTETPFGRLLTRNLARLGYADVVVRSKEVADTISQKTGKRITRQRISALLNADRVTDKTLRMLADGLGVDPSELTRDDGGK